MLQVDAKFAEEHFAEYLTAVSLGETVIINRDDKPIAELRPVTEAIAAEADQAHKVRRFGLWDGFGVSESFFEPLPDDLLKAFNGE